MTRIAIAGFAHETNTFSPIPTTYKSFTEGKDGMRGFVFADDMAQYKGKKVNSGSIGFMNRAEELGFECIFTMSAGHSPSAEMGMDTFNRIMEMILERIEKVKPLDGLFLDLHGAMVLEGYIDGETQIIKRIREVVGDIPIMATLDLHGNIHPDFFNDIDVLIGCREYPHIDFYEVGVQCADLMKYALDKKPVFKSLKQVDHLFCLSKASTFTEPMKSLYAAIPQAEELPGVLSATIMEGFPMADTDFTGPSVFAYAETKEAAEKAVELMYKAFEERFDQFTSELPEPKEAVAQAVELAIKEDKPVILADGLDNPGGGSTSDTVWILEELVRQNAPATGLAIMFDPETAEMAHQAGLGSKVSLKVGGKLMEGHKPFEGEFEIIGLHDGDFLGTGPMVKDVVLNLGKMALIKIGNVNVVVASDREQAADQSMFTILGLDPAEMEILVLKSSNHFRADFQPISSHIIYVDGSPAAMVEDPAKAPFKRLRDGMKLGGNGPIFKRG